MQELLLAMYEAPRCSGLHGVIRSVVHREARDDVLRRRGSGMSWSGGPDVEETTAELWIAATDRVRVDRGHAVSLVLGDETIRHGGDGDAIREPVTDPVDLLESVWRCRRLISVLDIEDVADSEVGGRSCWMVTATGDFRSDPLLSFTHPGERFTFWIDRSTGVALRVIGELTDGRPVSETTWDVFEPDIEIPDSIFREAIPADVAVRTPLEMLRRRAEEQGIDLSGVDTDDEQQMIRLLYPSSRSVGSGFDEEVSSDPPPDDERVDVSPSGSS